jgi:hypothetical protein
MTMTLFQADWTAAQKEGRSAYVRRLIKQDLQLLDQKQIEERMRKDE